TVRLVGVGSATPKQPDTTMQMRTVVARRAERFIPAWPPVLGGNLAGPRHTWRGPFPNHQVTETKSALTGASPAEYVLTKTAAVTTTPVSQPATPPTADWRIIFPRAASRYAAMYASRYSESRF